MIGFSPASVRLALFGGLALISYGALPMTAQADDADTTDQAPETVSTHPSAGGKRLLAATALLAASLVVMERFCSWRLGVRRRRAPVSPPTLAECLPSLDIGLPTGFSPTRKS